MNNKYREYFIFTKGERNGIMVLLSIIVLLLLAINLNQFFVKEKKYDFSAIQKTSDSIFAAIKADTLNHYKRKGFKKYQEEEFYARDQNIEVKYFYFDPNKIDRGKWEKLGLKPWQVEIIEKYKSKGGKFKIKKDLAKIYSIEKETYNSLEPYILLPDSIEKKQYDKTKQDFAETVKTENILIEKRSINLVDSISLIELKGIGPFLASRILNYRKKLGGFVNIEQLKEIDTGPLINIDIHTTELINTQFNFDVENIRKININTATAQLLRNHPYMNLAAANSIVLNRSKNGKYTSLEQIKSLKFMTDELYYKMLPYLSVD